MRTSEGLNLYSIKLSCAPIMALSQSLIIDNRI